MKIPRSVALLIAAVKTVAGEEKKNAEIRL